MLSEPPWTEITKFLVELFLDRRFGNSVMLLPYSPSYGTLLVEPGSFPWQANEFGYSMAWDTPTVKLLKSDAPGHWFPKVPKRLFCLFLTLELQGTAPPKKWSSQINPTVKTRRQRAAKALDL